MKKYLLFFNKTIFVYSISYIVYSKDGYPVSQFAGYPVKELKSTFLTG